MIGNHGRSATLEPTNQLVSLLDLRSEAVDGEEIAEIVTVTISALTDLPNSTATNTSILARALVEWGAGGVSPAATVDVRPGLLLSLPCSFLRVSAANEGSVSGSAYIVSASAGYYPRGGPSRITRTIRRDTSLGASSSLDITVPAFAEDVDVRRTPNGADYTLRFLDGGSSIRYEVAVGAGSEPGIIRLAPDIVTVRIVNGTTAIDSARAIFGLAL